MTALPFDDSRRLTGPNPYFSAPGAALESTGVPVDDARFERWRAHIMTMRAELGWPDGEIIARQHESGASLAFVAPVDQLFTATEVNEWAWGAACEVAVGEAPGHAASWDEKQAVRTLKALADAEALPALDAILRYAKEHRPDALLLVGEDFLSIGSGVHGRDYPLDALPAPGALPWDVLAAVPTTLVTGSNGKTTTVRLVAAMQRARRDRVGYCCTDGLFVEEEKLDTGDYSGPIGARTVLRRRDIDAAVLETARGGMLRRGLAVDRADVAIVTNVSADHFGEYGVHSLADLAAVKLTVAKAIHAEGLLVLNADDVSLRDAAASLDVPIGWFSLDAENPFLREYASQRPACVLREGCLWLHPHGIAQDGVNLGKVIHMPLSAEGLARYNIANLAGAALAGDALGVPLDTIRSVLEDFGRFNHDNRGRLERWDIAGVRVVLDYAHNPDGLAGLLHVATANQGTGRLGLILGHAGNRLDSDIHALAGVAAQHRPDRVVLKDISGYERGRVSGEIADLMRHTLETSGIASAAIDFIADEVDAVHSLLDWALPGDVLVLPIHGFAAKDSIIPMLDALAAKPG